MSLKSPSAQSNETMAREFFKHRPLADPKSSIRLLKLEAPAADEAGKPNSTIRLRLIDATLKKAPRYWALSYAWNDESLTEPVYCHGQEFRATPNCAAALRQLASEPGSRKYYLWVDAICIDQTETGEEERNDQLPLMADIYSRAARVVVWLGPGSPASAGTIWGIKLLATLARISPYLVSTLHRGMVKSATAASRATLPRGAGRLFTLFPSHFFEDCDPFSAVLKASWNDRLWTLQEVVLARRATVRAGPAAVAWTKLDRLSRAISAGNAETGFTRYPGDPFMRVRVVGALRGLLAGKRMPEQRYRLPKGHPLGRIEARVPREAEVGVVSHVIIAAGLKAGRMADKVYGQLAILQRHGVQLAKPDQKRPPQEIYRDAARAIIEHQSSLELLSFVSMERDLPGLPSWVPDFGFAWLSWIPGSEFAAAAGDISSPTQYRFDDDGNLLVHAQQMDRVRLKTTGTMSFFKELLQSIKVGTVLSPGAVMEVIRQLQSVVRFALAAGDARGSENRAEPLCMVLMQEMALSARSGSREHWPGLVKHVEKWANAVAEDIEFPSPMETRQPTETTPEGSPDADTPPPAAASAGPDTAEEDSKKAGTSSDDEQIIDPIAPLVPLINKLDRDPASVVIQHMAITRLDGNSLFVTESGRLGVATSQIQEGDAVYLVPGMRLPLIMREVEGGYRLLGSPFLDGAMRGELWRGGEGLDELKIV
ncbi:hypothetical protein N658DRAFT_496869 [Parathielavia hyrcaniae]|uniref:Heterokaryon incompatibility domain-containing protein n=1 Tax=Parathielavia hyrcaniae TaxID=113614 RepID=A0AAN6T0Z6_9PEZI|nr:hypothetical protein N658DRAFT_496869 [Parathielavia hyrcaniae]